MSRRPTVRTASVAAALLLALLALLPRAAWARPDDAAVRTLDAVAIEGEVRLPQVLFISSREAERPLDVLALWGPADPAALAGAVPFPAAIHRAPTAPAVPTAPATTAPIVPDPAASAAPGAPAATTPPDPSTRDATQEVPR